MDDAVDGGWTRKTTRHERYRKCLEPSYTDLQEVKDRETWVVYLAARRAQAWSQISHPARIGKLRIDLCRQAQADALRLPP